MQERQMGPPLPSSPHGEASDQLASLDCHPSLRTSYFTLKVGAGDTVLKIMDCRPGCGACCIAPSISTLDKPAGEPCVHLTPDYRCTLFGSLRRPSCCGGLRASIEMCGDNREHALAWLAQLEADTAAC